MNKLHTLAIATTLSVFTLGAQAAENFAGLTWGKLPGGSAGRCPARRRK